MKKYLKIFLLLGAAYIISYFSIKNVFIAQSPKLNPFFPQNMMAKVNSLWLKTTNFFAFKNSPVNTINNQLNNPSSQKSFTFSQQQIAETLKVPLTKVSQGVYAGEVNNTQVYEVRTNEIDYLVYTFNVSGKEIKIKVPKDQSPPSQEVMNSLYK